MRNRQGFTVAELMVTIAIVAVVTAIGAPSVVRYKQMKGVTDAADQLFTDLYRAKSLAIKNRETCTLTFNGANQTYQATFSDPSTGAVTAQSPVDLGRFHGGVRIVSDPGSGAASAATIIFNIRGTCPVGGSGAVYFTNADTTAFYRVRTTLAGGISIHRWDAASARWTAR